MSQVVAARKSPFYKIYRAMRKWRHYPRAYFELLSFLFRNRQDWTCINYGYAPDGGDTLTLLPQQEGERLPIQLYHLVASGAELRGKDVLEISSGGGGGAAFVARHHQPKSYCGLDVAGSAVAFCRRQHAVPGLSFVRGNAMELPFGAQTFDAVMSVEASHNYDDRAQVFRKIFEMLKPGGHFLYTDVMTHSLYLKAVGFLRDAGFVILKDEIISPQVLVSMEREDARKNAMIGRIVPGPLVKLAKFCVGTTDSYPYLKIKEGESTYFRVVAQKA
jgi:ubiquinone/menaquinone biosynthesis C-methylase UbiE